MPDTQQIEQKALADVNALKSWYASAKFWGPFAVGFVVHGLLRLALHIAFGWHA